MRATTLPTGDVDLRSTLAALAFLVGDPTVRLERGRFERATSTPDGPGAIVVTWREGAGEARVETHGDGAGWLLERAGALLGLEDDVRGFAPETEPLRTVWRRHAGDRISRTGTLWHDLAWFVVQQRIDRIDAADQWRRMVAALGTPAPGGLALTAPPPPEVVARTPYYELHPFGIERGRADTLRRAAQALARRPALAGAPAAPALRALGTIRGIGPWTTSCLAAQTWGERDTVIVGDHGIPSMISWLLARERTADDARMLELLESYRPHRYRVLRLAFLAGARPPRRAPRAALRRIGEL